MTLVAVLACLLAAIGGPATPAAAARGVENCAQPGTDIRGIPWHDQLLMPQKVRSFASGAGVTVAVLGSGVDATRRELDGHVADGFDAMDGGTANDDCLGLGTQLAGIIAARQPSGGGFTGLAPGATVLPVRILVSPLQASTPDTLAAGIRWAVEHGADVVDVAVAAFADSADLTAAVAEALARDVVVVAAVGDAGGQDGESPTPYPASYVGVLGVGAIDGAGNRWQNSSRGPYVDLVAPGAAVTTLQRGDGLVAVDGTGVASAFVAATAALVRERYPAASTGEVIRRLTTTTTPSVGSPQSPEYGSGVVNPYGAVTSLLGEDAARAPEALPPPARRGERAGHDSFARLGTLIGLVTALVVTVGAVALPRGRRRRWRPALAERPAPRIEPDDPGPPVMLFDEA